MKFGCKSKLRKHVKEVHEGIKIHQCQFCDKRFGRSEILKIHVETVHEGIKIHQYQFCDKKFVQLGHLNRHFKTVHLHEGVDQVDQSQLLKRKKQVDTTHKRSKNVKNSKRMKMLE